MTYDLFFVLCLLFVWSLSLYGFSAVGGYYGKKIDPEPGRCRRTDGKKWRCSRDAHPDSKYCDRHMIRRRYRSRKPVESQPHSSSASSNPVAASASAASSATGSAATSAAGSAAASAATLNTLPLHTNGAREGFTFTLGNSATTTAPTLSHLHMDPLTLSGDNTKKTYRYVYTHSPLSAWALCESFWIGYFFFSLPYLIMCEWHLKTSSCVIHVLDLIRRNTTVCHRCCSVNRVGYCVCCLLHLSLRVFDFWDCGNDCCDFLVECVSVLLHGNR